MEALLASAIRQMYTAGVNDADSDTWSEDDTKYESIIVKQHEMV